MRPKGNQKDSMKEVKKEGKGENKSDQGLGGLGSEAQGGDGRAVHLRVVVNPRVRAKVVVCECACVRTCMAVCTSEFGRVRV